MEVVERFASRIVYTAQRCRPRVALHLRRIASFTQLPAEEQERWLVRRMRVILARHARLVGQRSEWARVAKIENDEEFLRAWKELPVLRKADLQGRFSPEALRRAGVRGRTVRTGGSTGEPTGVVHDGELAAAISAMRLWVKLARGWKPGDAIVGIWGSDRDVGRSRKPWRSVANRWERLFLIGGFAVDRRIRDELLKIAKRLDRFFLYGYTSMLRHVAQEFVQEGDRSLIGKVVAAWNGAETMTEHDVEIVRAAFGVPLMNHYGGRELSTIAYQTVPTSRMVVARPNLIVELGEPVRLENGVVVGKVLCTALFGWGTPFVRYEIGDYASAKELDCDQIGPRNLLRVEGRTTEAIPLPDGTWLHGTFWYHLMTRFCVNEFCVEYWPGDRVRLKIVAPQLEEKQLEELERVGRERLRWLPLSLERVERVRGRGKGS